MLSCADLTSAQRFYTGELGFQIDVIFPADAPRQVKLSGYGICVRLERESDSVGVGTEEWGTGRAGMQYRDLIPDRLGGRCIASHIRIPVGGPVPDYVHHHDVEFQLIYCYRGWVKVVYEDQGPEFVMRPGDCVLQPPHIRHRVLECSDHMEVVEVSSPAEHETFVDHQMNLPTTHVDRQRDFGGQRFVRHELSKATWSSGPYEGYERRDTGIADATKNLASVQVVRPVAKGQSTVIRCDAGIVFSFVLQGKATLHKDNQVREILVAGDSFVILPDTPATITENSSDLEFLQVVLMC